MDALLATVEAMDDATVVGWAFFGSILAAIIVWQLLAAWARWYRRRRDSDFRKVKHVERRCERVGSQDEFSRRLRTGVAK